MNVKKIAVILAACALAASLVPVLFMRPRKVDMLRVGKENFEYVISGEGVVLWSSTAIISPVSGKIKDFSLRRGDKIKWDDVIARFDARQAEIELEIAENALSELGGSQAVLTRRQAAILCAQSVGCDYDEFQAAGSDALEVLSQSEGTTLKTAQAELAVQRARLALEAYTVRAPSDGWVARTCVSRGQSAAAGTLLAVICTGEPYIRAQFNDRYASLLREGGAITIVRRNGERIRGGFIGSAPCESEDISAAFDFRADDADGFERENERVSVEVTISEGLWACVPLSAVEYGDESARVYVLRAGRLRAVEVETGRVQGSSVQILSGINVGETIVRQASEASEGMRAEGVSDEISR